MAVEIEVFTELLRRYPGQEIYKTIRISNAFRFQIILL
jgi:hypothetical protein